MASGYVNHAFSAASNRVIQKESVHGPDKNLLSGFREKVSSEKKKQSRGLSDSVYSIHYTASLLGKLISKDYS